MFANEGKKAGESPWGHEIILKLDSAFSGFTYDLYSEGQV